MARELVADRLAEHLARIGEHTAERSPEMAELHRQATHDDLTGLRHRWGMHQVLDGLLIDGLREYGAVFYCDLDNSKRVNDGLGHEAGDKPLAGSSLIRQFRAGEHSQPAAPVGKRTSRRVVE